jgi:murein L,D-transpeptidase YafK
MKTTLACIGVWLALTVPLSLAEETVSGRWIEVDTAERTLTVHAADQHVLARFSNIATGSGGVAPVHYHGDATTPLGHFHIRDIRPSQRFDTFVLLDYPRPEHAAQAFDAGRIDAHTRAEIVVAAEFNDIPPQDTALGGEIGIHGVGHGNLRIHELYNWTDGCIALTNEQLHDLLHWLRLGMQVEIH